MKVDLVGAVYETEERANEHVRGREGGMETKQNRGLRADCINYE